MLLIRVREAEQLEATFNGPLPLLPSMVIPSAPPERRREIARPSRSWLSTANQAVTLATSLAPHGKLCAVLRTAPDPAWVMGEWKQAVVPSWFVIRTKTFPLHVLRARTL